MSLLILEYGIPSKFLLSDLTVKWCLDVQMCLHDALSSISFTQPQNHKSVSKY